VLTAFSVRDIIDAIMAIMVVKTCQEIEGGLPSKVTMKMYSNIILDSGIGLVPLVGDMTDDRGGAIATGGDGANIPAG
jgi:hypothetical protein